MKMNKEEIYSVRIKAGPKRTYYWDVKEKDNGQIFLQFSESYKKEEFGKENRSRIIIHKEDFKKVSNGLEEVLDYIKNELKVEFY